MLSLNVPACYQCIASQMRIHISSSDSRNELGFQHIFVTVNMMLNFVSRGRWRGIAGRSGGYLSGSKVQLLLFCFCCTEHQPVVGRWATFYPTASPDWEAPLWPCAMSMLLAHCTIQDSGPYLLNPNFIPTYSPQLDWVSEVFSLHPLMAEHELQVS